MAPERRTLSDLADEMNGNPELADALINRIAPADRDNAPQVAAFNSSI